MACHPLSPAWGGAATGPGPPEPSRLPQLWAPRFRKGEGWGALMGKDHPLETTQCLACSL